jgi:ArsR family transcriptional regulator, arsenate/arsenite/antimonite-responsive transcriptional repressor
VTELETSLKGLADVTRLRIVNLLCRGELCGCDIQRVLEASQSNVSRHLTYLKHAGLVLDRRDGFRVFYRLAPAESETRKDLLQFLAAAFRRDKGFCGDLRRLKEAIKDGACQMVPVKTRHPAFAASRGGQRVQRKGRATSLGRSPVIAP